MYIHVGNKIIVSDKNIVGILIVEHLQSLNGIIILLKAWMTV